MSLLLLGRWGEGEQQAWLQALQTALPDEQWLLERPQHADEAAQVEVAVVANPPPGSLAGLPKLRLIQSLWAGVERLLSDPTVPVDVPVSRMVDPAMNEAMVHTALWAVLGLHRGFFRLQAQQREAVWQALPQLRAQEWRVLVLGLGELGGRVARALAAQGYAVSGWSRSPRELVDVQCLHGEVGLLQGLAQANTIINLLPLTDATRGFFSSTRLAQCQRGAQLVNLARGAHVDEAALLDALDAGQIGHAVLDVFATEPLPRDHRFWAHPQVTVLPHTAAQTDPRTAAWVVVENLQALRAGRPLQHLVARTRGY